MSIRQTAQKYCLDRRTISKILENPVPPGYKRSKKVLKPKLDEHTEFIDQIIAQDKQNPKKQRHTIKRIFDRLKTERNFTGSYQTVRNYVKRTVPINKEMYVPLEGFVA